MKSFVKDFVRERICYYTSPFRGRSSMWEIAGYAAEHGARGVEMMNFCDELRTPDIAAARELGAFIRSEGMTLPCFSAGIDLAGEKRDENLKTLKGYAEICADLEIPYLHHTIAPYLDPTRVADGEEELFTRGLECAQEINEFAGRLGVRTIVEDQGFVFNGVQAFGRFRKESGGRIGTLLDVGNIMFVDEKAEAFLAAYGESTVHAHIKDYRISGTRPESEDCYVTRGGGFLTPVEVGTGDVDFEAIGAGLRRIGYTGVYSLEFTLTDGEAEMSRALEYLANVLG